MKETFDLSQVQKGHLPLLALPFKPNALIKQCIDLLTESASKKSLVLTYDVDENIPEYLIGDSERIGQILIKLVGNALKFTEEGSVHIDLFTFHKNTQNCTIECVVIDTGRGISKVNLPLLFDHSTDNTGLGLPMCKQWLEAMGGSIAVESELGQGTTFSFELNLSVPQSISSGQTLLPSYLYHFSNMHILLVDDNKENREVAGTLLKKMGIDADEAGNGEIAIEKIRKKKYDLVLMDIQMPKLDGLSTTKILRNEGLNDLLIIAVSAHTSKIQRQHSLDAGMNDYLTKPYTLNSLQALLVHWLPDKIIQKTKVSDTKTNSWVSELPAISGLVLRDEMSNYWLRKEDFLNKLKQFIHNTMDEYSRLHTMIGKKNISTALKTLHKIKGSVKLYGADRLFEIIEQLETTLNADEDANVSDLLHQLDTAIVELTA